MTGECLKTIINDNGDEPKSFSIFSNDNQYIIISTMNNVIELWNYQLNQIRRKYFVYFIFNILLQGHKCKAFVHNLCFSNNNQYIVSGSEDNNIYIWDINTTKIIQILEGHTNDILCVDSYNNIIASGGKDYTIRIWKFSE